MDRICIQQTLGLPGPCRPLVGWGGVWWPDPGQETGGAMCLYILCMYSLGQFQPTRIGCSRIRVEGEFCLETLIMPGIPRVWHTHVQPGVNPCTFQVCNGYLFSFSFYFIPPFLPTGDLKGHSPLHSPPRNKNVG